ncbi:hypothetical protein F5B22DRAFT_614790 [Xylaria bambusicola]|uniref:uncharacterized protein n=1 Tax=Xylaria bambusicola TaxID=326684 RepID=UPI0020072C09|nr:uncharacterized protein F5B22DRAFT_614790 [Xylaria bambusicola]KAI0512666.1 hypothetical protein F5B22DRAFT_614790 [Xylaria bambusicola]
MPVTELAWIPSNIPGTISPEFLNALREGMEAQGDWAAANASSTLPPGPPANRGAALYQQREDPGMVLITAHWDSKEQHLECIVSEENQQGLRAVADHSVVTEIKVFHVDGVQMFGKETLDAGRLSILRVGVKEGNREKLEKIWNEDAKNLVSSRAGFEHTGGWRIEKDQGEENVFAVVGSWRDEEALSRFAAGKEWEEMWKGAALKTDITTYSRIA